jgi:hypothetical protein
MGPYTFHLSANSAVPLVVHWYAEARWTASICARPCQHRTDCRKSPELKHGEEEPQQEHKGQIGERGKKGQAEAAHEGRRRKLPAV